MTEVLVRGVDFDAVIENTLLPPFGIGHGIVATDVVQWLVADLVDQDLRRALILRRPFLALALGLVGDGNALDRSHRRRTATTA